jgi:radical SAM superfamily enzyme YgiQ (UPF0313 family)
MELASRSPADRFVPAGAYRALAARLRERAEELSEMPAVVLSAFDRSTRMLPFIFYDSHIFPAGARAIAGCLYEAGFERTRAVHQLWNPNFRPSRARIDGRPVQMLLVSSMQIHSRPALEAIHEAWSLGADRPLILAGGPKAIYDPYGFWSTPGPGERVAPDVAVTGESYVLLDLLNVLLDHRGRSESLRTAFERARREGALESVPGLVYLAPGASLEEPVVVDTGLQRLVQDLDELPHEVTGLRLLEPPHRGPCLSRAPIPDTRVGRHVMIASVVMTQGCKFNCSYCPIPAVNQKSWRYRSPEALVHEIRSIHEAFGIRYAFGADDSFFNRRETAEAILTALSKAKTGVWRLGERIRFATEATELDTYRSRDLLPLAHAAGLHAIWFGIEDLTATLINKGQKPDLTVELFRLMHEQKISPMAMLMFHEGQPFHTAGSLYGLANQVAFLRRAGAISVQCTVHTPALHTREYEKVYEGGRVLARLGRHTIEESRFDGNHVLVVGQEAAWRRQLGVLGGYAAFYNPLNFVRAFKRDGSRLRRRRIGYQAAGQIATLFTAAKMTPYILRLMTGKPVFHSGPPPLRPVPVRETAAAFARLPPRE